MANGLFSHNSRYVPVSQALAEVMVELGIMQDFREQFNTIAERSLREAEDLENPGAIRAVATYFPGTDAALAAWRRLADRAWDRGQLAYMPRWPVARKSKVSHSGPNA